MTSPHSADDLYGKVPSDWEMDLTPPADWDVEDFVTINQDYSDYYKKRHASGRGVLDVWTSLVVQNYVFPSLVTDNVSVASYVAAMHNLAKQLAITTISKEQMAAILDEAYPRVRVCVEPDPEETLAPSGDEIHGNHVHAGTSKVPLPPRQFNSGPAYNQHARRGRGGRR